jgi:hypothetical protein
MMMMHQVQKQMIPGRISVRLLLLLLQQMMQRLLRLLHQNRASLLLL